MALRIFYTICFLALAVIDWIIGSRDGRMQFVATNCVGFIFGAMILSSGNHKPKDFIKPVYAVWTVLFAVGAVFALRWGLSNYPYKGQWITGVLLVGLYGYIFIRIVYRRFVEKIKINIKPVGMIIWVLMIALMLLSKNNGIWPFYYGVVFAAFFLTDFDNRHFKALMGGMTDGIILGFFVIEGMALLFRPFDMVRYYGMFGNPNITALFFMISYVAFLVKWYMARTAKKPVAVRIIIAFFAAAMYGFVLMTGCKTAFLGMILATIVFFICILKTEKKKVLAFFKYCAVIGIFAIISVPVVYLAARYMPTIHLHPVYFAGEYNEDKVLPGEPRDSEKYTSFEEMLEENVGRFLFFIYRKDEKAPEVSGAKKTETDSEAVPMTPEEEAELQKKIDEAIIKPGESAGPFRIRYIVHTYYLRQLNMTGHTYDQDGVPVFYSYHPEHAHNFLLQMSFWYGIPVGIILIVLIVMDCIALIRLFREGKYLPALIGGAFMSAILGFGMFEIIWRRGQLSLILVFLLLYPICNKSLTKLYEENEQEMAAKEIKGKNQ